MFTKARNKFSKLATVRVAEVFMRTMQNPGVQQQLLDWNKAQLNDQGVFADGVVTGEYSPAYAKVRAREGLQTDHVDLNFTGALQASMVVKEKGDEGVVISADMVKNGYDLQNRYPETLGLTADSKNQVKDIIKQVFVVELKKAVT